ncbi:hypothetical protein PAXINDRAFT_14174 [Paxillus involutus ATCC 200175]|uniref:Uncharacterized protein n=1 Tax=Paxillus involutus ATCC 200175 TaxID=664439 RepID=A0A0C9TC24_PAXIN|nr:hypothetical protein PAXINDRAFT_14174 [Paxillus involutus ATCC 200175]
MDTLLQIRNNQDRDREEANARLTALEGRGAQPSRGSCGGIRGRGAATAAKKRSRRQGRNVRAAEDLDVEADAEVGDNQVIFDDDAKDVTTASSQLSKPAGKARKELRKFVTAKFRKLCNVAEKQKWPSVEEKRVNTTTGEVYLTPNFERDVRDEDNQKIFDHVADQVWLDLKSKTKPDYLTNKKIRWDKTSLESFAKQTFRGFKPEWMAQKNGEAAKKKSREQRNNRWYQRRQQKAGRLLTATPAYIEAYQVDPTHLILGEHMSDEDSGPEATEEDGAQRTAWIRLMADNAGYGPDAVLDSFKVMEVVSTPWRSDEESILLTLRAFWWSGLSVKQKQQFPTRVEGTSRLPPRIPIVAPYNFGVNTAWLSTTIKEERYKTLLEDWGTYGDPEGFGSNSVACPVEGLGGSSGENGGQGNNDEQHHDLGEQ